MILLLKNQCDRTHHYLLSGNEYSIGRRNCDIVLSDDHSISRKHAIIKVEDELATLIDCKSRYNTFHDNNRVTPETAIHLKNNDVIKFGVYNKIYKVEVISLTTTCSGLTSTRKAKLKSNLDFIKVKFVDNWTSECTHLTVQEILLTVKVLHAVIDEKPIVTTAYWGEFVSNIKNNLQPPDRADYVPSVAEALLNNVNLTPNPQRKQLFDGKVVVFPTNKFKTQMGEIITKTGGAAHSWEEKPLTQTEVFNSIKKYIFIQSDNSQPIPMSLKAIYDKLVKIGQRTIPIQEIAMAVVHCSCEVDCNPMFQRAEQVFNQNKSVVTAMSATPLVTETQESQQFLLPSIREEIIIPETARSSVTDSLIFSGGSKRSATEDTTDNIVKKIKKEIFECKSEIAIEEIQLDDPSVIKKENNVNVMFGENMFVKKRKSQDTLEMLSKKPCLGVNPFANLRNKQTNAISKPSIKSQNPFANLRKNVLSSESKENMPSTSGSSSNKELSQTIGRNDFNTPEIGVNISLKQAMNAASKSSITSNANDSNGGFTKDTLNKSKNVINVNQKNDTSVMTSNTAITDNVRNAVGASDSTLNRTNHIGWLSKSNCSNGSKNTSIVICEEPLDAFINKFKNAIITVKMTSTPLNIIEKNNSKQQQQINNNDTTLSNKNFKKFKKIPPLHPQVTIVNTSVRQLNETTLDGPLSTEMQSTMHSTNQSAKRKFVF